MHQGAEKESRVDEQTFDDEHGDEQTFERNDERKGKSDENNYEQTEAKVMTNGGKYNRASVAGSWNSESIKSWLCLWAELSVKQNSDDWWPENIQGVFF